MIRWHHLNILLYIGQLSILMVSSTNIDTTSTIVAKPYIVGEIHNITAAVGKTAKFTCTVKNLNEYHVVWFHVERNMLLTIHSKVVTRIPRFNVFREDEERWTLQIQDVMREDKGAYACQVNTEPQLRELGYLDVVVPPEILDSKSSPSTVVMKENGNVTLSCFAEGNPKPTISWVREDQGPITITQRQKEYRINNRPDLKLRKVSRTDMGAYLCIASNGFPPTVSKRTVLYVEFSPIVIVPNQLMSAPKGTSVSIECITEAYPRAVTFWKYNGNMVMSTNKYNLKEIHENYRTRVILTINELTKHDFGTYMCNSRNSFGENGGSVELHELKIPETDNKQQSNKRPDRDKDEFIRNRPEYQSRSNSYERSGTQNHVMYDPSDRNRESSTNNSTRNRGINMFNQKGHNSGTYDLSREDRTSDSILAKFFPTNEALSSKYRVVPWALLASISIILRDLLFRQR